jgi:hypothetical protein
VRGIDLLRYFFVAALMATPITSAYAQSPSYCRTSVKPGETVDSRFVGLEYALMMHALAEKYCGATRTPMGPRFLGAIEKQGCGPETEIYRSIQKGISYMEGASLMRLAQGGDATLNLSEKQVQEWASTAVHELGGCEQLKKVHDSELEP